MIEKPSRVRIFTLIGGLVGAFTGFFITIWMSNDWPIMIGGKPFASIPPYIIIAYTQSYDDPRYNPYPRNVVIGENIAKDGGTKPDLTGGEQFAAAFGGALPPILWDGLADPEHPPLIVTSDTPGVSLNLTEQGQSFADAQPGPMEAPSEIEKWDMSGIGAPAELEARLK